MTDSPVDLEAVRQRMAAPEDVAPMDAPPMDGEAMDGGGPPPDAPGDPGPEPDGRGAPEDPGEPGIDWPALAALPLNDYGNGRRFAAHYGADLIHVPRVGWFTWTGQRWRADPDGIDVRRHAQKVAARVLDEIPHLALPPAEAALAARAVEAERALRRIGDGPEAAAEAEALRAAQRAGAAPRKRLGRMVGEHRSHARSSGNKSRIDALIGESVVELARPLETLDADPLMINTESGTLAFTVDPGGDGCSRTAAMELRPHARGDWLTKIMPVEFDPEARSPQFDAFLDRVQPDDEMRGFVQRWLGLSMTALPHQQLAFWYGGGANGKSVLIDLVARMLGDYSATAKIESLTGRNRRSGGDATPDLVPLIGARLVRASEPEEGERLQEGKIKELTGGEPILVRALNEDFVEVTPRFKLTISGNHKPEIRGGDDGIWRRMLLVPWDVTIPEAERDLALGEKLWSERSGILNWLIDGLMDCLEGGLCPPDRVREATADFRRESDPVGQFLADATVFTGDPGDVIRAADLVNRYNYWLLEAGMGQWKPRTIAMNLSAKAGSWRHPRGGGVMVKAKASVSQYTGLRMAETFEHRFGLAPKDQTGRPLGVAEDG